MQGVQKRLNKERTLLVQNITVTETIPEKQSYDTYICWVLRVPYILTPEHDHIRIELTFPQLYPFKVPSVRVLEPTHILKNICQCHASDGTLCVSEFLADWNPKMTAQTIVDKILALLQNP